MQRHIKSWIKIITNDFGLPIIKDSNVGFTVYKKEGYSLGSSFYLERVMQSHIHTCILVLKKSLKKIKKRPPNFLREINSILNISFKNNNYNKFELILEKISNLKVSHKTLGIENNYNFSNSETIVKLAIKFYARLLYLAEMKKWTRLDAIKEKSERK